MQEHSTNNTQNYDNNAEDEHTHSCAELKSLVYIDLQLLRAVDELLSAQGHYDPSTWSISQVMTYYEAFIEFHPTMTFQTLLGGIAVHVEALQARIRFERNDD